MKNKKAFTLIELLVVVLIIGILSAIALPQYEKAVIKSKMVEQVTLMRDMQKAVDLWLLQNGGFPSSETWVFSEDQNLLDLDFNVTWTHNGGNWETKNTIGVPIYCDATKCYWFFWAKGVGNSNPDLTVTRSDTGWTITCDTDNTGDANYCQLLTSMGVDWH